MRDREVRALRLYRSLLRMLPEDFAAAWGSDMQELFALRLRVAGSHRLRRAWVWCRAIADIVTLAAAERWARFGRVTLPRRGFETFTLDIRHALRALRSTPQFTLTAITALALGIGAATATFSVVHSVLLRQLPYADAESLVVVWPQVNANKAMVGLARAEMPSLAAVGGLSRWTLTLTGTGEPLEITGTLVSSGHFGLLRAHPALGRSFRDDDSLPGAAGVAVLAHDFWVRVLGADPDIVGRSIGIAGAEYERRTVIGVMPEGFRPVLGKTDVWIPLEGDPALGIEEDQSWYVNQRVARLAPGATLEQANLDLAAHAERVRARLPGIYDAEDVATATVQPLHEFISGTMGTTLWAAFGAVSLVLLIACANVANLLLARGEARALGLSLRAALGAGRGRLVRMLLTESTLLGLIGGTLGVAMAYGLVKIIVGYAPPDFPRLEEVAVRGQALGYALFTTLASTMIAGIVPALRAGRVRGSACLGGGARGAGKGVPSRLTTVLVATQLALAVVVAVGSGLMLRSLSELLAVDPGLDGNRVLTLRPNPLGGSYADAEAFRLYYDQVITRVAALPGVESVGAINILPGTDENWSFPTYPEGVDVPEGAGVPSVNFRAVGAGYFETVRIPLRSGRLFEKSDDAEAAGVALVNEAFVQRFWADAVPLGRTLRLFGPAAAPYQVVGVVGDVRQHSRSAEPRPEMYFPHAQVPWNQMSMWIMVRLESERPLEQAHAIRSAVWEVDGDVPIAGVDELSNVLGRSTRTTAFLALLLSAFGLSALALGAIGVFGVTSFSVGRRIPEFGVRLALGSSRGGVLRAAMERSLAPVLTGLLVGVGIATVASRALSSALYGVTHTDPPTFIAAVAVLAVVGAMAIFLPAWRATRVDPASALSAES